MEENSYSSSCDWPIALSSFPTFYPIKSSQSCGAEEGREDGGTQIAPQTLSIRMELLRSRAGLWLLVFMYGWCFGSVSCFVPNLDSEFTFLLPAGRTECFFQTAIKNGTMEVEYQVTAKEAGKQTLASSGGHIKMFVRLKLNAQSAFYGGFLRIRFPVLQ